MTSTEHRSLASLPFQKCSIPEGLLQSRNLIRDRLHPQARLHNQHVDPAEAVQIHKDLHARQSIGIHWGTFELTDEPLDEPPMALARERKKAGVPDADFVALRHGEMRKF